MEMKAVVFTELNKMELQSLPVPEPKEGEVLIKVQASGICGTDPKILSGEYDGSFPLIPGHEYAGQVVSVGPGIKKLKAGDRVAVDPNVNCGYCRYCQDGRANLCENLFPLGVMKPGGFAEYSVCPETHAYKLAENTSSLEGALVEPLACSIRGIYNSNIRLGDNVVLIGAGLMSNLLIQLCRLSGAGKILVSEPLESRKEAAYISGADIVINPEEEDLNEAINKHLDGGADVVFEVAGKTSTAQIASEIVNKGGRVCFFGTCHPGKTINVNPFILQEKENILSSAYNNPYTHLPAVRLLAGGRIKTGHLITHKFKFEQYRDAFEMFGREGTLKIMFVS